MFTLKPAICPQCGATLSVDQEKDAVICPYCNSALVVEKAIKKFNDMYVEKATIHANKVIVNGLNNDFVIQGGVLLEYHGSSEVVIIPEGVRSIGTYDESSGGKNSVFKDLFITKVVFPKSLQHVGYASFEGCSKLTEVVTNEGLSSIGAYAFRECNSLKTITIPKTVSEIGREAFKGCILIDNCIEITEDVQCTKKDKDIEHFMIHGNGYDLTIYTSTFDNKSPIYTAINTEYLKYWEKVLAPERKQRRVCRHCGGKLTGLITMSCSICGKPKDFF